MFGRIYIFFVFAISFTQPAIMLRRIAESQTFDRLDNFIPRYDEPIELSNMNDKLFEETKMIEKNEKHESLADSGQNVSSIAMPNLNIITDTSHSTMSLERNDTAEVKTRDDIFPSFGNETNRIPRQEMNDTEDDPEFKSEEKESQEDGSSSEEDTNMLTGLISAFLGGFSKPDGGIDVDAIVGLLGSLSTQKDDGSYDFQGLTDLLRGFFGGEGGSDVGAFAGGLLGAVIKGLANPPGAKGAGKLTGKIFAGLLPALSGPPDTDSEDLDGNKTPSKGGLDSGGFIVGLLKTILASSSGQGGPKINIIKTIFTSIASLSTSSSKKQ